MYIPTRGAEGCQASTTFFAGPPCVCRPYVCMSPSPMHTMHWVHCAARESWSDVPAHRHISLLKPPFSPKHMLHVLQC